MKRYDRSENYQELKTNLINNEYNSYDDFMSEVRYFLRQSDITNRHFILLKELGSKHFNVEDK